MADSEITRFHESALRTAIDKRGVVPVAIPEDPDRGQAATNFKVPASEFSSAEAIFEPVPPTESSLAGTMVTIKDTYHPEGQSVFVPTFVEMTPEEVEEIIDSL